jgi:Protein of unknown function (DUF3800)
MHPRNGKKVFCMLEAYMDESGIHDGAHVCVVAGYWGGEQQWRRFEPRWKKIIENADEPTLKEFHSTEFWKANGTRKGVYARWSKAKADQFIGDLLNCIGDYRLYPTSATLKVDAWNALNKNERMFLTGGRVNRETLQWITPSAPNQTYFLPFQFSISSPAIACKEHLKVHYAFDLNKQFKNHASDLFRLLKNDSTFSCRDRIGELSLPTSEEAVGLQAADLFAYHSYQYGKIRMKSIQPVAGTMPLILKALIKNARDITDFPFFDEYGLSIALQAMPKQLRG